MAAAISGLLLLGSTAAGAASDLLPKPTAEQLAYQQGEIMALIHFNMATYFGESGCTGANWNESSDPARFAPTALDTDNWVVSMRALGIKESVLTAKHGCGFCIWDTKATLPDGSAYAYKSSVDVVSQYVASMKKAGIGHGFYYSISGIPEAGNVYLAHLNITGAQLRRIQIEQLTELWTNYGNLTEIWLDGGFSEEIQAALKQTFTEYQPKVIAYNGGGVSKNPVRWVGTEGDMGSAYGDSIWSTYCCNNTPGKPCVVLHTNPCTLNSGPYGGGGCAATGEPHDAMCNTFYPAGLDYTLQAGDTWFYVPGTPLRPLSEMIAVYHNSVGRNTVMELAYSIDRTGRIDPAHARLYERFGTWIRQCYGGEPAGRAVLNGTAGVTTVEMNLGNAMADRFVLQEDQTAGQHILQYRVVRVDSGSVLSHGRSIGNKKIDLLGHNVTGAIRLEVQQTALDLAPRVRISAFAECPST